MRIQYQSSPPLAASPTFNLIVRNSEVVTNPRQGRQSISLTILKLQQRLVIPHRLHLYDQRVYALKSKSTDRDIFPCLSSFNLDLPRFFDRLHELIYSFIILPWSDKYVVLYSKPFSFFPFHKSRLQLVN